MDSRVLNSGRFRFGDFIFNVFFVVSVVCNSKRKDFFLKKVGIYCIVIFNFDYMFELLFMFFLCCYLLWIVICDDFGDKLLFSFIRCWFRLVNKLGRDCFFVVWELFICMCSWSLLGIGVWLILFCLLLWWCFMFLWCFWMCCLCRWWYWWRGWCCLCRWWCWWRGCLWGWWWNVFLWGWWCLWRWCLNGLW